MYLTIQTGKFYLSHNRPDIMFINKSKADTKFIDIAIPGDSQVSQKSVEKRDRNRDLSVIVSRLWNSCSTDCWSIWFNSYQSLTSIGLTLSVIPVMQKSVLLSTSRILRHYLFYFL